MSDTNRSPCLAEGDLGRCFTFAGAGTSIHVHSAGVGPAVVLLHGFPEYWAVWRHQFLDLSRDHLVIAPDLRGFNLSGRPAGSQCYTAAALAADLLAMLERLHVRTAHVVGHDLGGTVAWYLASVEADRVASLVLISSPHPADYLAYRLNRIRPERDYLDRILAGDIGDLMTPDRLAFWADGGQRRGLLVDAMRRSDMAAISALYRMNLSPHALPQWGALPPVSCATLVLLGEKDPFIPCAAFNGIDQRTRGVLEIHRFPDEGHFLHSVISDQITQTIRSWLERS